MLRILKKITALFLVCAAVALILDLNVKGRPARDWAAYFWHRPQVQSIYQSVRDRVLALLRKDISVEEVFQSDIPKPKSNRSDSSSAAIEGEVVRTKVIELEKLNEEDRKALEKILEKAAKK